MKAFAIYRKLDFTFPIRVEPQWSRFIDRWYQLDAFAYGLAEAYYSLRSEDESHPDFVFLASACSSNQTDFQFAHTGATSPSKFVHTLPNVRGSSLFQLMNYKGPLLCLQNDPSTQLTAIREALEMLGAQHQKIWIWSVSGNYTVHWFELVRELDKRVSHRSFVIERSHFSSAQAIIDDVAFLEWLVKPRASSFALPGNYAMRTFDQINN